MTLKRALGPGERSGEPPVLHDIASSSWEHPADRAALQTLEVVPEFEQLLEKCIGFLGERGIRSLFQANAVRVGPSQFPILHRLFADAKATLDWSDDVELFVSQNPAFNAGAYGVERPFIVLHSATVDRLDEPELRVLLGHELGHIMSGNVLYRTMLQLMLMGGFRHLPFLAGSALLPIRLSLLEWSRASELSCDRAGLLVAHGRDDALRLLMKSAGGAIEGHHFMSIEAYKEQVADYEFADGIEGAFKLLKLLDQAHPLHTMRAAELSRWSQGPEFANIRRGEYHRRSAQPGHVNSVADLRSAAEHSADHAKRLSSGPSSSIQKVAGPVSGWARRATGDALTAAHKNAANLGTRLAPEEPSDDEPKG
jgi:Zn-dependent protease with chaperone function